MALISVQDLYFRYDGCTEPIFDHVCLQLDTDWRLGFVGRNGKGKTTLLKLLLGEYQHQGTISAPVEFDYFPFQPGIPFANGEDLAGQLCPGLLHWKLVKEIKKLEMNEDILFRPFSTLSNGEQTKLLLAIMFLRDNRFLLIDEPTNHLDMLGREILSRYLNEKKGFIVVSHDQAFLDGCIDHILSINRATVEVQKGNCSSWLENRRRTDAFELAQNEKLEKEISRLEKSVSEKTAWANRSEREKIGFDPDKTEKNIGRRSYLGAKSKKANKRAKAIRVRQEAAIAEKSGLLKDLETAESIRLAYVPYRSEVLAELREVCIDYGNGPIFCPCSFSVRRGDRICLSGRNGTGKSSLLRLFTEETVPSSGIMRLGSGLVISCVPQDASWLKGRMQDFLEENALDRTRFFMFLRKLDFPRAQFDMPMENFSMGQKKKILLVRSFCQKANLYLWDEPLNYIDLISRGQIENLLLESQPTLIFVEHDKRFCEKIASNTVFLTQASNLPESSRRLTIN